MRIRPFIQYEKLDDGEKALLTESFSVEYGRKIGERFHGIREEKSDYDFIIQSDNEIIKIQHTIAAGSKSDEISELKYKGDFENYLESSKNPKLSSMTIDERIKKTIEKKENKYADSSDIVLLIQYDLFPGDLSFYANSIRDIVDKSDFKSIWIYSVFSRGSEDMKFICLKDSNLNQK